MRSTTKILDELGNDNNADVRVTLEEVEPLLEDSDRLDIIEDEEFEVVVDDGFFARTGISDIPSHDILLGEINRVIEILEPPIQTIQKAKLSNANQYYLRAALCIGGGLLVLAAPTLFTSLMWSQILRSTESMAPGLLAEITKYTDLLSKCKSEKNTFQSALMDRAGKLHEILRPVLEKWWTISGNGQDCAGWTIESGGEQFIKDRISHPHESEFRAEYWCSAAKELGTNGDPEVCLAAAKQGCALVTQHAEEATTLLHQYTKINDMDSQCRTLANTLGDLESQRDSTGFLDRINITNALIAGGLAVGAAVVVGLLIWAHNRAKNARVNNDEAASKLINLLGNAEDAATVINLCARLNIPFKPENSVAELITKLKTFRDELESLWKKRIAFLSGAKDPNSGIYGFFNNPASKDVKKLLINEAGLGLHKIGL